MGQNYINKKRANREREGEREEEEKIYHRSKIEAMNKKKNMKIALQYTLFVEFYF